MTNASSLSPKRDVAGERPPSLLIGRFEVTNVGATNFSLRHSRGAVVRNPSTRRCPCGRERRLGASLPPYRRPARARPPAGYPHLRGSAHIRIEGNSASARRNTTSVRGRRSSGDMPSVSSLVIPFDGPAARLRCRGSRAGRLLGSAQRDHRPIQRACDGLRVRRGEAGPQRHADSGVRAGAVADDSGVARIERRDPSIAQHSVRVWIE